MTRELLNKIAKSHKIDLSHYDHIYSRINDNYTKVVITFFQVEVISGCRRWCNQLTICLSISAISKRIYKAAINDEYEPFPEDYETNGSEWLFNIR